MPRYFFSCEGAETFQDHEGTDLADLHAARLQAIRQAGELIQDNPAGFEAVGWWRMAIRDEAGSELSVVTFDLSPRS